jgi:nitrite transporter NirC
MYNESLDTVSKAAEKKAYTLRNSSLSFFLSAFMAGLYISLGCIFMGVVAASMKAASMPFASLVGGLTFSIGLCCVTIAGADLFTGNVFTMWVGLSDSRVTHLDTFLVLLMSYVGNLIGSILAAATFYLTDIPTTGAVKEFFVSGAVSKITATPESLFAKGVLCNILVCVAIWCGFRLKSEAAKIAMNFCCVTAFVACGFEHSIGNMSFLAVALFVDTAAEVTIAGCLFNLLVVTIGNIVGGSIFVACPYVIQKLNNH